MGSPLSRALQVHLTGKPAFALPADLWSTLVAARRLLHLDLGGLYTAPTGLISFPGTALILVPVVALIEMAGLGLAAPSTINSHPVAWLFAGSYEMGLSGVALFAADSLAERLDVAQPKRALLATAGVVALGNVSLAGGHPEDAVAVGLFLAGILALSNSRARRSAWLVGAALAVQPLVLLALPSGRRRLRDTARSVKDSADHCEQRSHGPPHVITLARARDAAAATRHRQRHGVSPGRRSTTGTGADSAR